MQFPINLDLNATTPLDPEVAAAMRPYLDVELSGGNPSSTHALGSATKRAVEKARAQVARLLRCDPSEIVFTSGGSEGNNTAIQGVFLANRKKGNHIITSTVEHPAAAQACKFLAEYFGARVTYVECDSRGVIKLEELERAITPETVLITVMHANNEVGSIQPISEIAAIAKRHGVTFHSDGAQAVGKIPTDVKALGVDLYTVVGHKMFGPKGVGCLYMRAGVAVTPLIHGASHESNRRAGTENVLGLVGFGKAAELCAEHLDSYMQTMKASRDRLADGLQRLIPAEMMRVHTPLECALPNTLSIGFAGLEASTLLSELGDRVACSAGAACHSAGVTISSVLTAMKVPVQYALGTLRFSTGRYTTLQQVDAALAIISETVLRLLPEKESEVGSKEPMGPADLATVKLTRFTHGLGCACKLRPQLLEQIVSKLPNWGDPRLLVGTETGDDAAVYKLNDELALVLTDDFFTPVVDDPWHFGAIAAANSISDVYAMGGQPRCALSIVGFPNHRLPIQILEQIMQGASAKAAEAGCPIVGGHTISDTEPKFGLAVVGTVHPTRYVSNSGAQPGDWLILTKPLGLGIASTAIKRGLADSSLIRDATRVMETLNRGACESMVAVGVHSATDVTGFGLLGHLMGMTRGSHVDCDIYASSVPLIPGVEALATAGAIPGGLLIACPPENLDALLAKLRERLCGLEQPQPNDMAAPNQQKPHTSGTKDVLAAALIGRISGHGSGIIRVHPGLVPQ
ncbi:putative selenide, water dikinase [Paratrimastix pyriformis]|uniref:Selenide, water dikinase n=1 Tax=Paratrimastix pyriformis TaxID=342808 RepID=A0ABQ8UAW2_9EUKA|nr:putative selenide, water dikinase [Paratrimastix pyriformis]